MINNPVVYGGGGSRSITAVGHDKGLSTNDRKYIQFVMSEEDKELVLAQKSLSGAIVHGDFAYTDEIQHIYFYAGDGGEGTEAFVCYTNGSYAGGTMNSDVSVSGFSGGLLRISVVIFSDVVQFGNASEYYLFLDIKG